MNIVRIYFFLFLVPYHVVSYAMIADQKNLSCISIEKRREHIERLTKKVDNLVSEQKKLGNTIFHKDVLTTMYSLKQKIGMLEESIYFDLHKRKFSQVMGDIVFLRHLEVIRHNNGLDDVESYLNQLYDTQIDVDTNNHEDNYCYIN